MAGPHRTALVLLSGVLAVWLAVMSLTLARAESRGPLVVAVFPLGTSETRAMVAISRAGGRLVGGTWWPWAFVVQADGPVQARLAVEGAAAVLPAAPFRVAFTGGCGFAPLDGLAVRTKSVKVEPNAL